MLDALLTLDREIFLFINVTLANPVTNSLMPVITSDMLLRFVYGLTVLVLLIRGNNAVRIVVVASVLTLVITDQVSSALLKPLIGRARPCHNGEIETINLLVRCGAGMSMPSSHAANAFGQALLFGSLYRRLRWPFLIFAFLIAISRVFVGVHYLSDIIAGGLLGAVAGTAVFMLYRKVEKRWFSHAVPD